MEEEYIIGLKQDDQSIYLDLGGQSEIGGATLETLHQELVERFKVT